MKIAAAAAALGMMQKSIPPPSTPWKGVAGGGGRLAVSVTRFMNFNVHAFLCIGALKNYKVKIEYNV